MIVLPSRTIGLDGMRYNELLEGENSGSMNDDPFF